MKFISFILISLCSLAALCADDRQDCESRLLGNFKDGNNNRYLILADGSYWLAYEPLWGCPHFVNWQKTNRIAVKKSDSHSYTYKLVNLENGEEAYVSQFDPLLDLNSKLQDVIKALGILTSQNLPHK